MEGNETNGSDCLLLREMLDKRILEQSFTGSFWVESLCLVLSIIILVLGFFGNVLVVVVTARMPRLKTPTHFLLANLAIADLCVCVFCVLPRHWDLRSKSSNAGLPEWGNFVSELIFCRLNNYVQQFSLVASSVFLMLVTIERWVAIRRFSYSTPKTEWIKVTSICGWIFALIFSLPICWWSHMVKFIGGLDTTIIEETIGEACNLTVANLIPPHFTLTYLCLGSQDYEHYFELYAVLSLLLFVGTSACMTVLYGRIIHYLHMSLRTVITATNPNGVDDIPLTNHSGPDYNISTSCSVDHRCCVSCKRDHSATSYRPVSGYSGQSKLPALPDLSSQNSQTVPSRMSGHFDQFDASEVSDNACDDKRSTTPIPKSNRKTDFSQIQLPSGGAASAMKMPNGGGYSIVFTKNSNNSYSARDVNKGGVDTQSKPIVSSYLNISAGRKFFSFHEQLSSSDATTSSRTPSLRVPTAANKKDTSNHCCQSYHLKNCKFYRGHNYSDVVPVTQQNPQRNSSTRRHSYRSTTSMALQRLPSCLGGCCVNCVGNLGRTSAMNSSVETEMDSRPRARHSDDHHHPSYYHRVDRPESHTDNGTNNGSFRSTGPCSTQICDCPSIRQMESNRSRQLEIRDKVINERKRVVRLLIAVASLFVLLSLPYQILIMLQVFFTEAISHSMDVHFGVFTLVTLQSALNPFLYLRLSKNFRISLRNFFRIRCNSSQLRENSFK